MPQGWSGLEPLGQAVLGQEQHSIPFSSWTKAAPAATEYLPAIPEKSGLFLIEGLESILAYLAKDESGTIRGELKFAGEVNVLMKALRVHALELLPLAVQGGNVDLSLMAWQLVRNLTTFLAININVTTVHRDGVVHVLQIGPMTNGTPSFEICCVGYSTVRGGVEYNESIA